MEVFGSRVDTNAHKRKCVYESPVEYVCRHHVPALHHSRSRCQPCRPDEWVREYVFRCKTVSR
jgi:hypothetical protein